MTAKSGQAPRALARSPGRERCRYLGAVLTGVLLIAAGVAILLFSGASLSVSRQVGQAQAEAGRWRRVGPLYQRLLDFNVKTGPQIGVWLGRAVGVSAIVFGIALLFSS
jgi:uncharacterized membrane protein HdeD (DUF308 family)